MNISKHHCFERHNRLHALIILLPYIHILVAYVIAIAPIVWIFSTYLDN